MDSNRQQMKGKLADLRASKDRIRGKALQTCRVIMPMINPALAEIVDMDIPAAAEAMDELVMHQAGLLSISTQIKDLEEALYS
jgi:hypothetical protein